jgi:hypothetical protein
MQHRQDADIPTKQKQFVLPLKVKGCGEGEQPLASVINK